MKVKVLKFPSFNSLVSSILFLLFGILMFINPSWLTQFITYILGGILLTMGIFNVINYGIRLRKLSHISDSALTVGIILIIIGIITMFASAFIEVLLRFVIGAVLLFNGLSKLIYSINNPNKLLLLKLLIAILLIVGGLYTILVANLVFMTIGIIIIFFSVSKIIDYIFSQKNKDIIK